MSSMRQRKRKSNTKDKSPSSQKSKHAKKLHQNKLISWMSSMIILVVFMLLIYVVKQYSSSIDNLATNAMDDTETQSDEQLQVHKTSQESNEIDFTQIINSPRFSAKKTKKVAGLKYWIMDHFWAQQMALNISNQLYEEFMDETQRNKSFYFAINKGNEKIRGNNNIAQKTIDAHALKMRNRFSYCKYEYRRQLPLYQRVLSYLNSSYVTDIMSKVLKKKILGVSDLFISVFYKDNFLSTHDDQGLGHYAFVNMLSQYWDSDQFGGSLNFNCREAKGSCLEIKAEFNQNVVFKVFPNHVPHFVKEVTVNKPRIAITGWYYTAGPGVHWGAIGQETGYGLK